MNNEQNNQQSPHQNQENENNRFYQQPGYYPPPIADPSGDSSQALGIAAVVCLFFCQIVSIICGAIAIKNAKESRMLLQFETQAAKVGRICGILGLTLGILSVIGAVLYVALIVAVTLLNLIPY